MEVLYDFNPVFAEKQRRDAGDSLQILDNRYLVRAEFQHVQFREAEILNLLYFVTQQVELLQLVQTLEPFNRLYVVVG